MCAPHAVTALDYRMRRPAFIPLLCATALLLASCDQRPIDLAPQSTGMEWDAVARFNDRDGGEAHIWADGPDEIWFLSSY